MIADLLVSLVPYAVFPPLVYVLWNLAKASLTFGFYPVEPADSERELRLARARMRRLRTARYASEHESWSAEFSALTGGCPHCAGVRSSAARPASRYVPYL